MAQVFTIGQVARATGMAAKTIRYYEQIGVLPPPGRTASGYRQYDQLGVQCLRFIRRARALGLPLQDLKALTVGLNGGARAALRPRLLALVREQLSAVEHQITELKLLQEQLKEVSDRLLQAPRGRHTGPCRCLDIENAAQSPSAAANPTHMKRV